MPKKKKASQQNCSIIKGKPVSLMPENGVSLTFQITLSLQQVYKKKFEPTQMVHFLFSNWRLLLCLKCLASLGLPRTLKVSGTCPVLRVKHMLQCSVESGLWEIALFYKESLYKWHFLIPQANTLSVFRVGSAHFSDTNWVLLFFALVALLSLHGYRRKIDSVFCFCITNRIVILVPAAGPHSAHHNSHTNTWEQSY